ncbi:Uncharacterised protein [Chryseobacterium taihuense]|uniref:Uncharacterized protein n=1 Tax=Chryseobacterium taihuense TaxID=1141221 RepID=A0A4U8WEW1_9FLAO|nr:Uncharacterised protein [Chryseobacterium taihuense]
MLFFLEKYTIAINGNIPNPINCSFSANKNIDTNNTVITIRVSNMIKYAKIFGFNLKLIFESVLVTKNFKFL